jgi:hypothetical protein
MTTPPEETVANAREAGSEAARLLQLESISVRVRCIFLASDRGDDWIFGGGEALVRESEDEPERFVVRYPKMRLCQFGLTGLENVAGAWEWLWSANPFPPEVAWGTPDNLPFPRGSLSSVQWTEGGNRLSRWPFVTDGIRARTDARYRQWRRPCVGAGLPPVRHPAVAAHWFLREYADPRSQFDGNGSFKIVIEDTRARIQGVERHGDRLDVAVVARPNGKALLVQAVGTGTDTGWSEAMVVNGIAPVRLASQAGAMSIYLSDANGTCLDCRQAAHYVDRTALVEDRDRGTVLRALDTGETEAVEYKPALDLNTPATSDKLNEVRRSVVAMANLRGGVVVLGVTDQLELMPIEPFLERDGSLQDRKDRYAKQVLRRVQEGIRPSPDLTPHWCEVEPGRSVLALLVREVDGRQPLTIDGAHTYVRLGATNRCVHMDQVARLVKDDRPGAREPVSLAALFADDDVPLRIDFRRYAIRGQLW